MTVTKLSAIIKLALGSLILTPTFFFFQTDEDKFEF